MKSAQKVRAMELRRNGESIKTIAAKLNVSSGSVSRWCINIRLSQKQKAHLNVKQQEAGRRALAPVIALRKNTKSLDIEMQTQLGRQDVGNHSKRDLLMFGLGLYWGEGYKRGNDEWGFTNCDPAVIRTILTWLRNCYGIGTERIIARLTLNDRYKSEERRIVKEWVRETGIQSTQFGSTSFISGYGNPSGDPRTYRGTLRIKVRSGTSLRRRILASIAVMGSQIAPISRKTFS